MTTSSTEGQIVETGSEIPFSVERHRGVSTHDRSRICIGRSMH